MTKNSAPAQHGLCIYTPFRSVQSYCPPGNKCLARNYYSQNAISHKTKNDSLFRYHSSYITIHLIGATGFEPATSRPPAVRATKLRHTPFGTFSIITDHNKKCKSFFKKSNFFEFRNKTAFLLSFSDLTLTPCRNRSDMKLTPATIHCFLPSTKAGAAHI